MKFRGKIVEIGCIRQFTHLINLIARLAKLSVVRITPDKIYFVVNEVGASGGCSPGLWAELDQGHFFNTYDMEGVSADHNEIFLELIPDKLAKSLNSLKSSQAAKSLKIKLTRKHSPCLTFEVELPSLSARSRLVVHDIPVELIPRRLWNLYQEPNMPPFQASVYLPPLKQLRHVVERMKNLSAHATLSANCRGTLIVSVKADMVTASTYFRNLSMPPLDGVASDDPEELQSATVEVKKLAVFLQGDQINPNKVICNIVKGKVIHFFFLHDDVTLQYFLPAVVAS